MGFRFSTEQANWLAHVLQSVGATPRPEPSDRERLPLRAFLESFSRTFYSSRPEWRALKGRLDDLLEERDPHPTAFMDPLWALREYFRDLAWVALLLPGGNRQAEGFLGRRELLEELVRLGPRESGLILQLDSAPPRPIRLEEAFPAFRVALAEITRWPGVLLWTPTGDAALFELSTDTAEIRSRATWIFSRLADRYGTPEIEAIKEEFEREVVAREACKPKPQIIQVCDLRLGG